MNDPNDFNWYVKEILPQIPPTWGNGSPSGTLEVRFRQGAFQIDEPDSELINCGVNASGALRDVWFDKKRDYLHLRFILVVADASGNRTTAWRYTTTTKERKAKLEAEAHFGLAGRAPLAYLEVRLVLTPKGPRPGGIGWQGTGSKRVVGGGLPS